MRTAQGLILNNIYVLQGTFLVVSNKQTFNFSLGKRDSYEFHLLPSDLPQNISMRTENFFPIVAEISKIVLRLQSPQLIEVAYTE